MGKAARFAGEYIGLDQIRETIPDIVFKWYQFILKTSLPSYSALVLITTSILDPVVRGVCMWGSSAWLLP